MLHYHLSPIAVAPEKWHQGYASALLGDQMAIFDQEGWPCYLETQTVENQSLYEKFGFETVYDGVISGTRVPHIAVLRMPQKG